MKDELLEKAEAVKLELNERFGLKGPLRSPAHITLHRPFQWKKEKETQLIAQLSGFKFPGSFELKLHNFACFEPRVIYIDVIPDPQLQELQQQLTRFAGSSLGLTNQADDLRGFHPHVTVAFRDLKKPLFYDLWKEFEKREFNGSMQVTSFELLRLSNKWEVIRSFSI